MSRSPGARIAPRSWLFTPGDQPAKMTKAAASGVGAAILDLEDSVEETSKPAARAAIKAFVEGYASAGPELWVRINPLSTAHAAADLAAVVRAGLDGIVLPKPDGPKDVVRLSRELDRLEAEAGLAKDTIAILPIATETPASIFSLGGYRVVGPRLIGLTWGAEDLPAAVGAQINRNANGQLTDLCRIARSLCIAGAAAAEVVAIETVYPAFKDLDGLRSYAEAGRREGFTGMMAIHPSQVQVIEEVFRPSKAEIEHARQVVDLFAASPHAGALVLGGRMVDRPHLQQAERLLSRL